jgi:hypothetical protein
MEMRRTHDRRADRRKGSGKEYRRATGERSRASSEIRLDNSDLAGSAIIAHRLRFQWTIYLSRATRKMATWRLLRGFIRFERKQARRSFKDSVGFCWEPRDSHSADLSSHARLSSCSRLYAYQPLPASRRALCIRVVSAVSINPLTSRVPIRNTPLPRN